MVPPTDPWYVDLSEQNAYDPEGAQALLAEAGVTDLSISVDYIPDDTTEAILALLTKNLAAV
ncbi:ABC transporter substrate-binding protein, partial [Agrobacterium sp. S2]|nr:ABC transporter substrate-binding protein [Agrobacterium sp. S2]